jgi:hypothetical protein
MADPMIDPKNELNDKVSFLDKAIAGLSNLTHLEVNTLVGDYSFNKTGNTNTSIDVVSTKEHMSSQINMLSGDITTAMTEKFVTDYQELRDYHMLRENQGHDIIMKNIEVLGKILGAIKDFTKEKTQPQPTSLNP